MTKIDKEADEVLRSSRRTSKEPVESMEMRVKMRDGTGDIRSVKNVHAQAKELKEGAETILYRIAGEFTQICEVILNNIIFQYSWLNGFPVHWMDEQQAKEARVEAVKGRLEWLSVLKFYNVLDVGWVDERGKVGKNARNGQPGRFGPRRHWPTGCHIHLFVRL